MTEPLDVVTTDKPFHDYPLRPDTPDAVKYLHHLPETCWTSSKNGKPKVMLRPTGIMLHKISCSRDHPDDPFNPQTIDNEILIPGRYSYNLMVFRDAEAARRVPEGLQAFHAGLSLYQGEPYCNRFMIGISIVSKGKSDQTSMAFETPQIEKVADCCAWLINEHDMDPNRIDSHENCREAWNQAHPERKGDSRRGDPGDFPWPLFRELLKSKL